MSDKRNICPNCKHPNLVSKRYCRKCDMKLSIFVFILLLLAPGVAFANPTYLECTIQKDKLVTFKVALDEVAGTATFSDDGISRGSSHRVAAHFTSDSVRFNWVLMPIGIKLQYKIDRVTLAFEETLTYRTSSVKTGVCVIAPNVERVF